MLIIQFPGFYADYQRASEINLITRAQVVYDVFFSSHFGKKWGTRRAIEVSVLRKITGGTIVIQIKCDIMFHVEAILKVT